MKVLIIDDEMGICKTTAHTLEGMGYETDTARDAATALGKLERNSFDAALLDLKLPDNEGLGVLPELFRAEPSLVVIVFTAYATIATAVEAIKKGAYDYVPKPFTPDQLRQVFQKIERVRRLEGRVVELEGELAMDSPVPLFESQEPKVRRVLDMAAKVAPTPSTVSLLGESGTGKTVLARWVHRRSPRANQPFVTVHAPSLNRELLESELFGHVRGAFTGAVQDTKGKVAVAEKGTLFLDEIGEIPLDLQSKLLRLLQEKEYERVGDSRTRQADVRLIAASNRDLNALVKEGGFREDLYYRLNVVPITLPPLRERVSDLEVIAQRYLRFYAQRLGRQLSGFTPAALKAMRNYSWPGNLRELENAIERAVILARSDEVDVGDLPETVQEAEGTKADVTVGKWIPLRELEQEHIRRVMQTTDNLDQAARILGIDTATLYRKRKRFNLT